MQKMRFILASGSFLLNKGFEQLLKEERELEVVWTTETPSQLISGIRNFSPDFLILASHIIDNLLLKELKIFLNGDHPFKIFVINTGGKIPGELTEISSVIFNFSDSKSDLARKLHTFIKNYEHEDYDKTASSALTNREQNILREVTLGLTNKEIGEKLFISIHTVITHRKNITQKLGIKTVSGLTVYAILNKIVNLEEISNRENL